ncbi:MAG: response regulator transcription factor [Chthoniobacterales bacterium]|nr:response regulator transcription factor [Chthoniobacterales bacterium]
MTPKNAVVARHRIIVVDDHPLFRKGVIQMLSQEPDLEVRAEAEDSRTALDLMRRTPIDLAIVDIGLHGSTNGIELTKSIKAEHPKLPVLVLSMHDESLYAQRALRAGASGYLMKREALDSVISAVRSVLEGDIYVSPMMSKRMIAEHVGASGHTESPVEKLTDRELEVLQLIGEGNEVRGIAEKLHVSAKTVEAHRAHIKEKLSFSNAREVARFAVQWVDSQR